MKYTKKHKNLIAKLFKKAGMPEEAGTILSCDKYNHDIANAMRDAARKAMSKMRANKSNRRLQRH